MLPYKSDAGSNPRRATAILMFMVFLDLLGFGVVVPLLPEYATYMGASAGLVGVLVASYSFMQFIFGPLLGKLSDALGRRPIILVTLGLNALGFLVLGIASTLALVFVGRLISGAATANLSVIQAALSDLSKPEERAKVFGFIGAAFGIGFVLGPPIGALINQLFGMTAVGLSVSGLCVLNLAFATLFLPETKIERLDRNVKGKGRPLFMAGSLRRLYAIMFLFTAAYSVMPVVGVLIFAQRFSLSATEIGYVFALIGIITAVGQALIGPLTDRFGEKPVLATGLLAIGTGIGALPYIPAPWFIGIGLISLAVYALGHAFAHPNLTALAAAEVGPSAQGAVLGQLQASGSLALIIGPLLSGYLYDVDQRIPFAVTLLAIAGAFALAVSHPRSRAQTVQQ
ncbi:MAG: MFS transporter [Pseudomonadota bacterium]